MGVSLKKTVILFVLIATAGWVSCGGGGNSSNQGPRLTFLAKRAFITNSSTTNGAAVVHIIDAVKDVPGNHSMTVAPGTNVIATSIPGQVSVVSSKTTAQVAIIDNVLEGVKGTVSLPAETESMAVTPDGKFAFAAVHNTNSIEIIDLSNSVLCTPLTSTCRGPITVSAPTKIVLSGDGKTLLAFSSDPNTGNLNANVSTVAMIDVATATSPTGPGTPKFVGGFDHPVTAVFNTDNVNAFVMNCGSECGGGSPGVHVLNTSGSGSLGAAVTGVPATVGALDNGNLYVAGTIPPSPGSPVVLNSGQITK